MSRRGGGARVRIVDAVVRRQPTSEHTTGEVRGGLAWWGGGGKRLAKQAAAAHDGVLLGMVLRSGVVRVASSTVPWRCGWRRPGACSTAVEGGCEEAM